MVNANPVADLAALIDAADCPVIVAGYGCIRSGAREVVAIAKAGLKARARIDWDGQDETRYLSRLEQIAADLKRSMKSELAEKVETVYAEVYYYPLGLAILLLIAETFLGEAPVRIFSRRRPPAVSSKASKLRKALAEVKREA